MISARAMRGSILSRSVLGALAMIGLVVSMFATNAVAVAAPDVDPPTWPVGSTVSVDAVTSTTASLSWTAAVDDVGVAGYRVYASGSEIAASAGTSVVITGLTPATGYSVRVEAFDAAGNESTAGGGFTLSARVDVYAGQNVHSVKAVDVNGDGNTDFVSAVSGDDSVAVTLGNGDGTFQTSSRYRAGVAPGGDAVYPKNAFVVDIDADGVLDVITANQNADTMGVLFGNGDGSFGSLQALATCVGAHDVTAGDYNKDGRVDLAAACWGSTAMTIYYQAANGTFPTRTDIETGEASTCLANGRCAHGVGTADLDGDGDDDLAIAAYAGVTANVLLGDGTGAFATPVKYTATGNPHDIRIDDFNGDGVPDLVTANESSDQITVFLGDGDGTFTENASYAAADEPKGVTTGDLNGDGIVDIAVGSAGKNYPVPSGPGGDLVTIWLGNGDGTFYSGGRVGGFTDPESVFDVAIGDFNGDGVADVAASNWHSGNVSMFFGSSSGGPAASFTTDDSAPPVAVDNGPYPVASAGGTYSKSAPGVLGNDSGDTALTAVKVSDPAHGTVTLNSDGSFAYINDAKGATTDSFTYQAKDGTGKLSNTATVTFTIAPIPPDPPIEQGHAVGFVDPGTGKWYLYDDSGTLVTSFYYGKPGDYPFMGDWDGDGIETPGLYRQSDGYVYLRNSNSVGVADIRFFFGNPGDIPLAGDFNGNGKDTVSIYRPSNQTFYIINELGSNDGGLGAAEFSYVFGNPGDKPFVGDFDGDGIETVGLHRESTGLVYFRNTHTQGVADAQFIFGNPGDRLVAGDWNGNGVFTPALFRPSNTTMYFRYTNTQGVADNQFVPVPTNPAWLPVSGNR